MLTEGYTEKIIFEQRPGGHGTIRQKKKKPSGMNIPGRRESKSKSVYLGWERITQGIEVIRY